MWRRAAAADEREFDARVGVAYPVLALESRIGCGAAAAAEEEAEARSLWHGTSAHHEVGSTTARGADQRALAIFLEITSPVPSIPGIPPGLSPETHQGTSREME